MIRENEITSILVLFIQRKGGWRMIPDIGLMVGAYIFTRMVSVLTRKGDREESVLVRVFAGITVLVTVICIWDLLMSGQTIPKLGK